MKKVTLQDIFNAAWQRFIIEEAPPAVDNKNEGTNAPAYFVCRYLTKDGRKCAIGLCIPDGHRAQKEMNNFGALLEREDKVAEDIFDESVLSLPYLVRYEFQAALHDRMVDPGTGNWRTECPLTVRRRQYEDVAKKFKLTIPGEPNDECGTTQSDS